MIELLAALAVSAQSSASSAALRLCKPALARKAGGEISTIDVDWARASRGSIDVTGRLTAFLGQGRPAPGMTSSHHLIRADFHYRCRITHGRVHAASVSPAQN